MAPIAIAASELPAGSKVPEFTLSTLDGATVSSQSLAAKVTVIAFVGALCPISNAYNQRLITMYREFTPKDVRFVFVNSNSNETTAQMKLYAQQAALPYLVYKDWSNRVADLFGTQTTPEVFVLDSERRLRYHGAIDDAQNEARVRVRGLRSAIESLLNGTPVDPVETKAFGCSLHRVRPTAH